MCILNGPKGQMRRTASYEAAVACKKAWNKKLVGKKKNHRPPRRR